jgi:hypothetical protein
MPTPRDMGLKSVGRSTTGRATTGRATAGSTIVLRSLTFGKRFDLGAFEEAVLVGVPFGHQAVHPLGEFLGRDLAVAILVELHDGLDQSLGIGLSSPAWTASWRSATWRAIEIFRRSATWSTWASATGWARGSNFVLGDDPVLVLIELGEAGRGLGEFLRGDLAVLVEVERQEDQVWRRRGWGWWRKVIRAKVFGPRRTASVLIASVTSTRPRGSLTGVLILGLCLDGEPR